MPNALKVGMFRFPAGNATVPQSGSAFDRQHEMFAYTDTRFDAP